MSASEPSPVDGKVKLKKVRSSEEAGPEFLHSDGHMESEMADRIISILEERSHEASGWGRRMAELEADFGLRVYSVLIFILAQLDFPALRAKEHWDGVVKQWGQMNARFPEGVDLRVAVLHYFLRIQRKLRNPAIVEIRILRKAQGSMVVDELTQLYNFRHFQERLKHEVKRARRYEVPLSLLMIDADDFKAFNDTHGHLAGNVALRRLARALTKSVRDVDVVARYGGEEFAILLPNTPKTAALQVAEKVRATVERSAIGAEAGGRRGLTVSIGVASLPADATRGDDLVQKADRALYVAKSLGKNRVRPVSDGRREFTRIGTSLMGSFYVLAEKSQPLTTRNVSEGGLLFLSTEPLAVGSLVQVNLKLPPEGEAIRAVLRVSRVVEHPEHAEGYEVGASIVHMSKTHHRRFRAYLASLRETEPETAATLEPLT